MSKRGLKYGKRKGDGPIEVERVPLSQLRRRREGKHHELMLLVVKELERLSSSSALKIQLRNIPSKNLRSAVVRAASARNIEIASFSDRKYLYVWKKHATTRNPGKSSS